MDNKLSELSKPVAWKLHHHDRYYFEENADVVAIAESVGKAKGDAVYSQEYVSALLAELEAKDKRIAELEDNERVARDLVARNGEIEGLRKRAAELGAKLATPLVINLPERRDDNHEWGGVSPTEAFNTCRSICGLMFRQQLRAAGFTVEGDEQ
ncbi:hypothetical protein [Serratia marcescens]|uniref:hypothetical protein n=1 Tax=Serratia marcescens TaxID=615 RepID=UPI0007452FFF|nr:hypothetical protein [Serratia marcescens]CVA03105.1 Uncharacterised protein [Serratia marcescens]